MRCDAAVRGHSCVQHQVYRAPGEPQLALQHRDVRQGRHSDQRCCTGRRTSHIAPTAAVTPQSPAACTSVPENLNAGGTCTHRRVSEPATHTRLEQQPLQRTPQFTSRNGNCVHRRDCQTPAPATHGCTLQQPLPEDASGHGLAPALPVEVAAATLSRHPAYPTTPESRGPALEQTSAAFPLPQRTHCVCQLPEHRLPRHSGSPRRALQQGLAAKAQEVSLHSDQTHCVTNTPANADLTVCAPATRVVQLWLTPQGDRMLDRSARSPSRVRVPEPVCTFPVCHDAGVHLRRPARGLCPPGSPVPGRARRSTAPGAAVGGQSSLCVQQASVSWVPAPEESNRATDAWEPGWTQEQKVNRVAQVALAGLAAVYMATAPAAHAATVKQVLCASNPTAKVRTMSRRADARSVCKREILLTGTVLRGVAFVRLFLHQAMCMPRRSACATPPLQSGAASASRLVGQRRLRRVVHLGC